MNCAFINIESHNLKKYQGLSLYVDRNVSKILDETSFHFLPLVAALSAWVVVSYHPPFSSRHWKVKTSLNVGDDFKILSGFFEIGPVI